MDRHKMSALIIRHLTSEGREHRFQVQRLSDGKSADPVSLADPSTTPVPDRPQSGLSTEVRWYLEHFLEYPFPPETDRAERVQAVLNDWGQENFSALFGSGGGRDFYHDAERSGLERLTLKVASDDPRILAWPWEALRDPQAGTLAHYCVIERQLSKQHDPPPLHEGLPRERINLLLVTARPYQGDVGFRTLSRPLLAIIEQERLPVYVQLLRPPSFDRLREHLRERPGFYHIVHFDGHGGYGPAPDPGPHLLRGHEGRLIFETPDGKEDPITAEQLSTLLREHRIPIMVLNACQSAMVDAEAESAFASVAAALQRAGVRSVVAMAYALYVSGAEVFLPAFYHRLFQTGQIAEAVRAGRQVMLRANGRVCARGRFPLEDWVVPVLYQQDPLTLDLAAQSTVPVHRDLDRIPAEARDDANPYGLIGRDNALLQLERALRRPPAGVLIQGLAGVGKTTLAKGYLKWLLDTGGLSEPCIWFTFNDIHSSEYVINRLVAEVLGTDALVLDLAQKVEKLVQGLRDRPVLIVWDNFESVCGIPGTEVQALLSPADRDQLRGLLYKLRGGKARIIITSRGPEDWLAPTYCFRLPLGGLQGEERWSYCEAIIHDLGLSLDRDDPELIGLMDLLDGHPLMMRVLLLQLNQRSAAALTTELRDRFEHAKGSENEEQSKLFATLRFVEDAVPITLRVLLVPLAWHERFVDANFLEAMAKEAGSSYQREQIDQLLASLENAGLVQHHGQAVYAMHPALSGFLRSRIALQEAMYESWRRAFVEVMAALADHLAPKLLHEQRSAFYWHEANFHTALRESERLSMDHHYAALLQSLAAHAENRRELTIAQHYFKRLAEHCKVRLNAKGEAAAYHQLGRIAEEQRDLKGAEQRYRKSLAISEKHGNEHGAAMTYHHLGIIAQEQRDFKRAKQWHLKSLAIDEKHGNEHGAAKTYHHLGIIAHKQRDFKRAEQWYRKSLAISEKRGDEHGAAMTYHELGRTAQEQHDFKRAEQWYRKSLAITEKRGDEHGATITYHELGRTAQEQHDFKRAEQWYLKSLAITEKRGDEHRAAPNYHELGRIAQDQRDFKSAEQWYQKSLAILEKHGDEHLVALTRSELGRLALAQGRVLDTGRCFVEVITVLLRHNDLHNAQIVVGNFVIAYQSASPDNKAKLKRLWDEAGLGPMPVAE